MIITTVPTSVVTDYNMATVTTQNNVGDFTLSAASTTIPQVSSSLIKMKDGRGLEETISDITDRLFILRPDLPLHSEYAELKELYEQYNIKLEEIREKIKMWNTLSK